MSKEGEIILPTGPSPAMVKSPEKLIVFSKPKTGKTSAFAQLKNWLILDIDKGSGYVDCMAMKAGSVEEIGQIMAKIREEGKPYDGIVIDTATSLEDLCVPYAEKLYARTSMGKNWFLKKRGSQEYDPQSGKAQFGNILNLPMGAGYQYLRQAFMRVISSVEASAPRIIISCHLKEIFLDKKGVEFSSLDISLTGKIKIMTTSSSDAIGYLYRSGNENILSFETTDEISCGARPEHLRNQKIVLSEMTDGKLITHWDKIYID